MICFKNCKVVAEYCLQWKQMCMIISLFILCSFSLFIYYVERPKTDRLISLIKSRTLTTSENNNKNISCRSTDLSARRLHILTNGSTTLSYDNIGRELNLQLQNVFEVTAIVLNLSPLCSNCDHCTFEIRVGYDSKKPNNNAVCFYSKISMEKQKYTKRIVCGTCPLYGDRVTIRVFGNCNRLEMDETSVYGRDAPVQCAVKPTCNKSGDPNIWHQWIDKDIDIRRVFESIIYKYLRPWLSLSAEKMHGSDHKSHVKPLELYVEYPLISPLDIAAMFGQDTYHWCCRIRWNQRYSDDAGIWYSKLVFNSSHIESIHSPNRPDYKGACGIVLEQFRYLVDNSPRQSLPEYMDIIYQFGDFPQMPLSLLANSDQPNMQRSQSGSLLPNWLTREGGFLGGIDYYTLNYTVPLLDIPPPMLSHCTTDQHIDIPWFFFGKWKSDPIERYLTALATKTAQLEDCLSLCDTSYEWHTRRHQATWRGSLTAIYPNIKLAGNWKHHQRVALRKQSVDHTNIIDAQILHCDSCSNETRQSLLDALGPFVEPREMNNYDRSYLIYKGLIDIDGVTWSARTYQLLAQGAVLFKQKSHYKEWWTDLLLPRIHYVPLSYDMSDTASVVESILADERLSKSIAHAGVRFAATYLRHESWMLYSQMFLRSYSALLIKPWQKHAHIDTRYLFKHAEDIQREWKAFRP